MRACVQERVREGGFFDVKIAPFFMHTCHDIGLDKLQAHPSKSMSCFVCAWWHAAKKVPLDGDQVTACDTVLVVW